VKSVGSETVYQIGYQFGVIIKIWYTKKCFKTSVFAKNFHPHTVEVKGSNPLPPIISSKIGRFCEAPFAALLMVLKIVCNFGVIMFIQLIEF
jgi:hypothetical protein